MEQKNDNKVTGIKINFVKSKCIICNRCKNESLIEKNGNNIIIKCECGHEEGPFKSIKHFHETQKIDLSQIKCGCNNCNNDRSTCSNFFKCITCEINLCNICKNKHSKANVNHYIINYDDINTICCFDKDGHKNERLNSYCNQCHVNLCWDCEKEHEEHDIINFKNLLKHNNEYFNNKKKLSDLLIEFKKLIYAIIFILISILKNFELKIEIIDDIKSGFKIESRNYNRILNNKTINEIQKECLNDLDEIAHKDNVIDIFNKIISISNKDFKLNEIKNKYLLNDIKNFLLGNQLNRINKNSPKNRFCIMPILTIQLNSSLKNYKDRINQREVDRENENNENKNEEYEIISEASEYENNFNKNENNENNENYVNNNERNDNRQELNETILEEFKNINEPTEKITKYNENSNEEIDSINEEIESINEEIESINEEIGNCDEYEYNEIILEEINELNKNSNKYNDKRNKPNENILKKIENNNKLNESINDENEYTFEENGYKGNSNEFNENILEENKNNNEPNEISNEQNYNRNRYNENNEKTIEQSENITYLNKNVGNIKITEHNEIKNENELNLNENQYNDYIIENEKNESINNIESNIINNKSTKRKKENMLNLEKMKICIKLKYLVKKNETKIKMFDNNFIKNNSKKDCAIIYKGKMV